MHVSLLTSSGGDYATTYPHKVEQVEQMMSGWRNYDIIESNSLYYWHASFYVYSGITSLLPLIKMEESGQILAKAACISLQCE